MFPRWCLSYSGLGRLYTTWALASFVMLIWLSVYIKLWVELTDGAADAFSLLLLLNATAVDYTGANANTQCILLIGIGPYGRLGAVLSSPSRNMFFYTSGQAERSQSKSSHVPNCSCNATQSIQYNRRVVNIIFFSTRDARFISIIAKLHAIFFLSVV